MINENTSLKNRHTLFIGKSGSGKSQALKQSAVSDAKRVILFDPNKDHVCNARLTTRAEFARWLSKFEATGKPYSVAFSPLSDSREDDHEFFCLCVLHVLDGRHLTLVIDEELAQSCRSASKADRNHKKMINEGRKYGLIYHGAIQIPQRVPKDVYDNCETLFIGQSLRLPKYVTERLPKEIEKQVKDLKPLEFFVCLPSGDIAKKQFNYKK